MQGAALLDAIVVQAGLVLELLATINNAHLLDYSPVEIKNSSHLAALGLPAPAAASRALSEWTEVADSTSMATVLPEGHFTKTCIICTGNDGSGGRGNGV